MNIDRRNLQIHDNCSLFTVWLFALLIISVAGYPQQDRSYNFPTKRVYPNALPKKENLWIFIMVGQSNMAGRGNVEPLDTIPNDRIFTVNAQNNIIIAKEPLHFYEPNLTGLDCGLSFANRLIEKVGSDVSILLIPAAVGGSSTHQWLGDSVHRGVRLMTNFRYRLDAVSKYGTVKGILWHQGESDTDPQKIPGYEERLRKIFEQFRRYCSDPSLPIFIGKLGSYSNNPSEWSAINTAIEKYAAADKNAFVIETGDLKSKDDKIHFDGEGQRAMGRRFAEKYLKTYSR